MNEVHTAIIVDDEQSARNILSELLTKFCPQVNVLDTCSNLEEATKSIKQYQPQLVFLDIEMPNYAGYEIVSFFDVLDFEIIFITAYDQYAIKAFEISAVDYLLKPIDIDRLKQAIKRFEDKKKLKNVRLAYEALKENLKKEQITKICIPFQGEQKVIAFREIIAFEAQEAYTAIHTRNGDRFVVSKNLKHYEKLLNDNPDFFRTHKSWLVNLNTVDSYSKSDLTLTMKPHLTAKLSKYRKTDFEAKFTKK